MLFEECTIVVFRRDISFVFVDVTGETVARQAHELSVDEHKALTAIAYRVDRRLSGLSLPTVDDPLGDGGMFAETTEVAHNHLAETIGQLKRRVREAQVMLERTQEILQGGDDDAG